MALPSRWEWCSDRQWLAYQQPWHSKLLLIGGMGSGKTVVQLRRILSYLLKYPGCRVLIIRKVAKQMRQTVMTSFYAAVPKAYIHKRNDSDSTCVLKNGSQVIFLHLDKPDSEGALLSLDINAVYFEEAVEIEEKHFDMALRRLGRWLNATMPPEAYLPSWKWRTPEGTPIPEPMVLLSSNPSDDEHHWIFERFYDESTVRHEKKHLQVGADGKPTGVKLSYAELGYIKMRLPSYENRFLSIENLQELYGTGEIDRFVEGEWGKRKGSIHTIHPDSLIIGTDEIVKMLLRRCRLSRILDHGSTGVTCCGWFGTDSEGNVYAIREYYQPDKQISEHREVITELSKGERYAESLADPSMFSKYRGKGGIMWSWAEEYSDTVTYPPNTAIFWGKANNDEHGTRNRINEYLAFDQLHINPFTQQRGSPRLFFILKSKEHEHGIVHMHRQTTAARRVQLDDETFSIDRDEKVIDHSYDTLRYYMAGRQPAKVTKQLWPEDSIGADIQRRIAARKAREAQGKQYGL